MIGRLQRLNSDEGIGTINDWCRLEVAAARCAATLPCLATPSATRKRHLPFAWRSWTNLSQTSLPVNR